MEARGAPFYGHTEQARWVGPFLVSRNRYTPGLRLDRHVHGRPYLSVVLAGAYLEACGSAAETCTPGALLFHPAGEEHTNSFPVTGATVLSIDLRQAASDAGIAHRFRTARFEIRTAARLALQIDREFASPCSTADLLVESLAFELLTNCLRPGTGGARGTPGWLPAAVELASDCYSDPLTLADVAAAVQVHPVHLARHFRRRMGCTFGEFMRRLRLNRARTRLLTGDTPVAQIAAETGFADQSHLTRLFKSAFGISPAAFRKTHRRPGCP